MGNKKKNESKSGPQMIEVDVVSISVNDIGHGIRRVTVVVDYVGNLDLDDEIIPTERLSIEVPSHAPPPEA